MNILIAVLLVAAGLAGLGVGAEWLVRGGSRIASTLGISPLVVGLTIVAYGTSAPELTASLVAAFHGHTDVTLGNVIGSNIANIGLILGVTAIISPFAVALRSLRWQLASMFFLTLIFYGLAFRLEFGLLIGIMFLLGLVLLTAITLFSSRKEPFEVKEQYVEFEKIKLKERRLTLTKNLTMIFSGLCLLIVGGHLTVKGAVAMARHMGISEVIIGLTLVAVGTSLPELAASLVAALRGEADICLGNLVGSNTLNLLGGIGLSAVIRPLKVSPGLLRFEFPALVIFTGALLAVLLNKRRVMRWEGILLLAGYAAFNLVLCLR